MPGAFIPAIPFIDLKSQKDRIRAAVMAAVERVVDHGGYIMGPEIAAFERDLAAFCGARHALSCANGTDALGLVLMAQGVGPGDAVLCPSFTFAATAEVIAWVGATAVFVDCRADTYGMNVNSLAAGFDTAKALGLRPACVIPVDLFGLPADYDAIEALAASHGAFVLADAAQSFGASYKGRAVGTIGLATSTSFFPAKPLGCYGDGGAVLTDDEALLKRLRSLRVHGQGSDKYDNVAIGMNARLDTLQAAILIEKLKIFADEIMARDQAARRYGELLAGVPGIRAVPHVPPGSTSVWAQYTIQVDPGRRDDFAARLKADGVPTAIYYSKPLHQQTAYRHYPSAGGGSLAVSEQLTKSVISLPMHPYLTANTQEQIAAIIRAALSEVGP